MSYLDLVDERLRIDETNSYVLANIVLDVPLFRLDIVRKTGYKNPRQYRKNKDRYSRVKDKYEDDPKKQTTATLEEGISYLLRPQGKREKVRGLWTQRSFNLFGLVEKDRNPDLRVICLCLTPEQVKMEEMPLILKNGIRAFHPLHPQNKEKDVVSETFYYGYIGQSGKNGKIYLYNEIAYECIFNHHKYIIRNFNSITRETLVDCTGVCGFYSTALNIVTIPQGVVVTKSGHEYAIKNGHGIVRKSFLRHAKKFQELYPLEVIRTQEANGFSEQTSYNPEVHNDINPDFVGSSGEKFIDYCYDEQERELWKYRSMSFSELLQCIQDAKRYSSTGEEINKQAFSATEFLEFLKNCDVKQDIIDDISRDPYVINGLAMDIKNYILMVIQACGFTAYRGILIPCVYDENSTDTSLVVPDIHDRYDVLQDGFETLAWRYPIVSRRTKTKATLQRGNKVSKRIANDKVVQHRTVCSSDSLYRPDMVIKGTLMCVPDEEFDELFVHSVEKEYRVQDVDMIIPTEDCKVVGTDFADNADIQYFTKETLMTWIAEYAEGNLFAAPEFVSKEKGV